MSYIVEVHFKLETALQDKTGILSFHHLISGLGREWGRGCSRGGGWGCCRGLWGVVHRASGPVGGRGGPRLCSYFRGAIRTGCGGGIWGDVLCRSGHFVRTAHKHWKWQHEFWSSFLESNGIDVRRWNTSIKAMKMSKTYCILYDDTNRKGNVFLKIK